MPVRLMPALVGAGVLTPTQGTITIKTVSLGQSEGVSVAHAYLLPIAPNAVGVLSDPPTSQELTQAGPLGWEKRMDAAGATLAASDGGRQLAVGVTSAAPNGTAQDIVVTYSHDGKDYQLHVPLRIRAPSGAC